MSFLLIEEQQQALELMLSGKNTFLTGKAGSGKSIVVNEFIKQCKRNLMVLAPTGIAAKNLTNGTTIHAGLKLPSQYFSRAWNPMYIKHFKALLSNVDVILIDEISMVRSDLFNAIDIQLKLYNNSTKPFAGKQIIVVGDFFQLPPVVADNYIWYNLLSEYNGIYAFNADVWDQANFSNVYLEVIHRQCNQDDLYLLNAIRDGEINAAEFCRRGRFSYSNTYRNGAITLCTFRSWAELINNKIVNSLEDVGAIFKAKITGDYPSKDYPTACRLHLKRYERVMILSNCRGKNDELIYANGDIGTILDYDVNQHRVKIQLDSGNLVVIEAIDFINYKTIYEADNEGKIIVSQQEKGRFRQLPIIPAYAITIHKSQGLTFDKLHIILGDFGCFVHGQLYTALSRVKDFSNLTLDREIIDNEILVDSGVIDFYLKTFNHT